MKFKYHPKKEDFNKFILTKKKIAQLAGMNRWDLDYRCKTKSLSDDERHRLYHNVIGWADKFYEFASKLLENKE